MANIRDVARLAGTSVATVSAVLNSSSPVSPPLRARVLQAIQQLNYHPSAVARSLSTRRTCTIGLVMPHILTPAAPPFIRAVENEVANAGYSLLLALSDGDSRREREMISLMAQKRVDGLLVSVSSSWDDETADQIEALAASGTTRVVFAARRSERLKNLDSVVSDNFNGAHAVTSHLLDLGCTHVALLALPPVSLVERDRILGYELAHRERGLTPRPELRRWGSTSESPDGIALAHAVTRDLFAVERPPDAILVCNQTMVLGVLQALGELKLDVPRDVAVACFDDAPWLQRLPVPVTAVSQRSDVVGRRAVHLLLQRLQAGVETAPSRMEVVPAELVVRASTAARAALAFASYASAAVPDSTQTLGNEGS
jgi:LacI family transcriptional regulator